jgi:hydroxyacylglutathione hydrolase
MNFQHFVFNELSVNAFVLYDHTGKCILVDPACHSGYEQEELTGFLKSNQLTPVAIVNTHGHFDHIWGNAWLKRTYPCPIWLHENDLFQLENSTRYAIAFGFTIEKPPLPDSYLTEGVNVQFGESSISVLHVPGHSPGSVCLYAKNESLLLCGDVLFCGSVGRSDFPEGNHEQLIRGIREKLMVLPPATVVWPGHGPQTTIGYEYDTNPFLS